MKKTYLLLGLLGLSSCSFRSNLGNSNDGSTGDASADDGSIVDGSTVDGSTVDGSTVDGSTVDGSTVDGSTVDGSTVDGSTVDGSIVGPGCTILSEALVSTSAAACRNPSYTIDSTGARHLAWLTGAVNAQGNYGHASSTGSWSSSPGLFGSDLRGISMAADSSGDPSVIASSNNGTLALWDGPPWVQRHFVANENSLPTGRALAFDGTGTLKGVYRPTHSITTFPDPTSDLHAIDYFTATATTLSSNQLRIGTVGQIINIADFYLSRNNTPYLLFSHSGAYYVQSPPTAAQALPVQNPSDWFEATQASATIATDSAGVLYLLGERALPASALKQTLLARRSAAGSWTVDVVATSTSAPCNANPSVGSTCAVSNVTYGPSGSLVTRSIRPMLVLRKVREFGTRTWQCPTPGDCQWTGNVTTEVSFVTSELVVTGAVTLSDVAVSLDISANLAAAANPLDGVHVVAVENSAQFLAGTCRIREFKLACGTR